MSGLNYDECTNWRHEVASKLYDDVIALSPMRAKQFLKEEKFIDDSYEKYNLSTKEAITARDRNDVMTCDLVFANFLGAKKVSIGSVIELGWADAWRKPIVIVMEPDNIHQHSIVNTICGFKVQTLEEGIDIANSVVSMQLARNNI